MIKHRMTPYPLTFFLSIFFGLLMIFIVIVSYLKVSHGHIAVGIFFGLGATVILAFFLTWVEIRPVDDGTDHEIEKRRNRNRQLTKGRS